MKLLSGNSNRSLAGAIADYLDLPLTKATVRRFADNEVFVTVDENVRGEDVFVIQSTCAPTLTSELACSMPLASTVCWMSPLATVTVSGATCAGGLTNWCQTNHPATATTSSATNSQKPRPRARRRLVGLAGAGLAAAADG